MHHHPEPLFTVENSPKSISPLRGDAALNQLSELGIELEVLKQALMSGHNGAAQVTAAHPKTAAGTYRWYETVAALRDSLIQEGWKQTDHRNAPRIMHPELNVSIMVATGNEKTGTKDTPSNATAKGVMTQRDVWNNSDSEQQVIQEVVEMIESQTPATWVLLYFYSQKFNHIRAELSLASAMDDRGFITKWEERLILPVMDLSGEDELLDIQSDDVPEDIIFEIGNEQAS